jgi:hypothetical protein
MSKEFLDKNDELEQAIDNFFSQNAKFFEQLTSEEIQKIKQSFIENDIFPISIEINDGNLRDLERRYKILIIKGKNSQKNDVIRVIPVFPDLQDEKNMALTPNRFDEFWAGINLTEKTEQIDDLIEQLIFAANDDNKFFPRLLMAVGPKEYEDNNSIADIEEELLNLIENMVKEKKSQAEITAEINKKITRNRINKNYS